MGLCKEGILAESEVSAFKSHLLDTLVASPADYEQPTILKDKLVFLQELLYAKCITEDEYHSSKRPLLQRLAVQGAEIEARDVIASATKESSDEWSVIDLKDEKSLLTKENSNSKTKLKNGSAARRSNSGFGFGSSQRNGKGKENKGPIDPGPDHFSSPFASAKNELGISRENPFWDSNLRQKESETKCILMMESSPPESKKVENRSEGERSEKSKKKMFRSLFQKEERHENGDHGLDYEEKVSKSGKKQWGFDGFKKWKKSESEDETAPLPLSERSDSEAFSGSNRLVASPVGEGPDTKQIKRKLHSNGAPSDFFVDKVLGEKIKKELLRIQTELNAKNPNVQLSNDQIDAISTRLPVDKADLKNFFPKSWCDRYGDVVLNVVRKEFKDHVGEMETLKNAAREKQNNNSSSKRWATFDDDENCHPNLFAPQDSSFPMKQAKYAPISDDRALKCFKNNPFFEDIDLTHVDGNKVNPFWSPRHGSSMLG